MNLQNRLKIQTKWKSKKERKFHSIKKWGVSTAIKLRPMNRRQYQKRRGFPGHLWPHSCSGGYSLRIKDAQMSVELGAPP